MAWVSITEADLLTVMSGPELSGYRAAALGSGQADPVAPTIAAVIDEARGYIAGCSRNVLGPEGTIPSKLKAACLDIVAVRIPGRVNKDPKPGREDRANDARDLLKDVARCHFAIDEPAEPSSEPVASPTPLINTRTRLWTADTQDGL